MKINQTITLKNHQIDKIIELLEKACEESKNYEDIKTYTGLISSIEKERTN